MGLDVSDNSDETAPEKARRWVSYITYDGIFPIPCSKMAIQNWLTQRADVEEPETSTDS